MVSIAKKSKKNKNKNKSIKNKIKYITVQNKKIQNGHKDAHVFRNGQHGYKVNKSNYSRIRKDVKVNPIVNPSFNQFY